MIISPPFLPPRVAGESDADWIARCMTGDAPGDGAFPVSHHLQWHGGLHLTAPALGNGAEPVRAVADGEVIFRRAPGAQTEGTDTGALVLRHRTEIGEGANASVTFYSIYMHLAEIDPTVPASGAVWRKARLGLAGQIDGAAQRKIHFEIVCDDDNLARLVGRASGARPLTAHGRSDAVYGEIYFHLPPGTPLFAQQPLSNSARARTQPPAPRGQPAPALQDLAPVASTAEDLVVGLRYGNGDTPHPGGATLTTYRLDGSEVGRMPTDAQAEYELFEAARRVSEAYPDGARPAPTAVFELMRLGRVLGPDALAPADVPLWRQVVHVGGQAWVNLNAANVHKFSDADFPQWRDWTLVDDSADNDCRCDSPTIRGWLDIDGDGHVTPTEAQSRLNGGAALARKLARTVCKFPTEWDAASIDARWGWLKQQSPENPEPMSGDDFEALRAHITALAFWNGSLGLGTNHWHWNPREFIRHFRQCAWLSRNEFRQMQPSHAVRTATQNHHQVVLWEPVAAMSSGESSVPVRHLPALNKMIRKYGITTPTRLAAFFGNALQETMWTRTLAEDHGGAKWYAPWYGRGFLQLTNPENYCNYWTWRGRAVPAALKNALVTAYTAIYGIHPDSARSNATLQDRLFPALTAQMIEWRSDVQGSTAPDPTAEQLHAPTDSAGFYWASTHMARYADEPCTLERVSVNTTSGAKAYYRSQAFWRASATVNLPGVVSHTNYVGINGFDSRCCGYGVVLAVVAEVMFPGAQGVASVAYPEGFTKTLP